MTATDADVICELEKRRFETIVERDFHGFADLAHPELAYTHSSGTLDTLDSFIEKCESTYYAYHRIDHLVESVTVVGDTAVVIGEMRVDMTAGGTRRELVNRSLGVWARVDGTWRFLAHQATAKR
ncbi:nuclear transport factor 2 family protein [Streptomyces dangxiongensis]|uniref:nuclear transport factor 2 family protein n=1 Tax=Streptomyces dangxiongensis TaxID=1442032 RepID=UPI001F08E281|nr:nuclear transport factor 2 family protein [Streptomyces dangxiongensis]